MRAGRTAMLLSVSLVVPVHHAGAQRCRGASSFAAGASRIGAGAAFTDGAKSYGAQLAFGAVTGPFAAATYTHTTFDNANFPLNGVGIDVGYQIPVSKDSRVEFCPIAGVGYTRGSNDYFGADVTISGTTWGVGGSIGFLASTSESVDFVPAVGAQYFFSDAKVSFSAFGGSQSGSGSSDYGVFTVGGGFIFNKTVTLLPQVQIPFGVDNGKATYGLGIGFSFGERRK